MGEFYDGIRGAQFLFDGDTRDLLNTIGDLALKARMRRAQLERTPSHPNLDQLIDEEENVLGFLRQMDQRVEDLFRRYLDLSKVGLRGRLRRV